MKNAIFEYESVSDIAAITAANVPEFNQERFTNLFTDRDQNWLGVPDAPTLRKVMKSGWPDGVAKMLASFGKIGTDLQATSVKRKLVRGAYGDELDIHRVNSGSLADAWSSRKRQRRTAPTVITVACNLVAAYNITGEQLFWRGAAVLRLAEILTDAGYAVNIVGYASGANAFTNGAGFTVQTTLKHSDEPFEINSLATTLCLSGFFRVYQLGAMLQHPVKAEVNLGTAKIDCVPPELTNALIAQGDIFSQASAEQWLRNTLTKLEGEAV